MAEMKTLVSNVQNSLRVYNSEGKYMIMAEFDSDRFFYYMG